VAALAIALGAGLLGLVSPSPADASICTGSGSVVSYQCEVRSTGGLRNGRVDVSKASRWTRIAAPAPPPVTDWGAEMLANVNSRRSAAGVAPLAMCGNLVRQAQAHSEDQARTGVMSHTGSDGSTMRQRAERAHYLPAPGAWTIGENVAYGYPTVSGVMTAWMNSSGHRANLLNPAFTHLGVGRAQGATAVFWTQNFGAGGVC
jgi:uncharacterized protein YkwD